MDGCQCAETLNKTALFYHECVLWKYHINVLVQRTCVSIALAVHKIDLEKQRKVVVSCSHYPYLAPHQFPTLSTKARFVFFFSFSNLRKLRKLSRNIPLYHENAVLSACMANTKSFSALCLYKKCSIESPNMHSHNKRIQQVFPLKIVMSETQFLFPVYLPTNVTVKFVIYKEKIPAPQLTA